VSSAPRLDRGLPDLGVALADPMAWVAPRREERFVVLSGRRETLRQTEIQNLTSAIATGASAKRQRLQVDLMALDVVPTLTHRDREELRGELVDEGDRARRSRWLKEASSMACFAS
jgi:hypothetical protein